jgi:hypothetical protein
MAVEPPARSLLIVTGSTLRAEEVDRPLAYYLKQRIEQLPPAGAGSGVGAGAGDPPPGPFRVRVLADFRWIHEKKLQGLPTISIGGPGVNALARDWLEVVPVTLAVDEQYYIQMDPDLEETRASIWGMDNSTTQIAVAVFLERFLSRFLEQCASGAQNLTDLDEID